MSLKVLHLIDSGGLYGAEKMLLTLASSQLRAGLDPVIMSVGEPGVVEKPIEKEAALAGLKVCRWRMSPGFNLREAWKIVQYGKANGFHVLHSHGYKFNLLMGVWPRKVRGLPVVATLHGYVGAPKYSRMWLYEVADRRILRRLDSVVVVNPLMKEIPAVKRICQQKLHDVPNGIDLAASSARIDDDNASLTKFLESRNPVVGIIGRLSREKGHAYLLEAIRNLAEDYPSIGLLVIGEGYERHNLEKQIAELRLGDRVHLAGYKQNASAYMEYMDVLVMPSTTEGLPITLLEAMASRTPIVASAVGGIPELLDNGKCGVLINPRNSASIVAAVTSVLSDFNRTAAMTSSAFIRVQEHYSAEAMTHRYLQVYSTTLCREAG